MATGDQNQIEVLNNLRKQLAIAVRSIQWSYAVFWSPSSTQSGVLEWGDGYYNGDIKTRKTVQSAELNADQMGLQRSDQLRELYESLSLGEMNPQAKRPTAALSPEDLTDAEWYFLVCMSFVFNIDQGLPGRTLAMNKTIWLCNAHLTDTKFFSRSLLAKSASIQTIVCFPHLGGVIELGATELVPEDLNLIQHIKTSFLESPSMTSPYDNNIPEDNLGRLLDYPDMDINSPNDSSNEFADNLLRDESNLVEGVDAEASQIQSWPVMDDAISNCLNNSANSSDCVSQTYEDRDTMVPIIEGNKLELLNNNNNNINNQQQLNNDDVHYQSVLSNLLKSSHQLMLGPYFRNGGKKSSFVGWRKDGPSRRAESGSKQKMLKKVLFEVAKMHENSKVEAGKNDNAEPRREVEEVDRNHVLSERKRREKINERFSILGSLIPSGGKVDKVSVLDYTIQYLRDLERKVEELESFKESMEIDSTTQTKHQDAIERTSDNYGPNKIGNSKKPSTNKRKASEMGKTGAENNITVSVIDRDVLIEMKCPWKDGVLVEIMEIVSKLRMDMQTVQSSNNDDGILSITLKAKCKGLRAPSINVIRQALQKVIKKC
ncbi:endoglucanase 3 [Castilleja foliolosa]|uniref:Endoglucanase 3 n=1 Tax=Castilleja foliolosa TaxID=1961234 RepID=A0ABD3D0P6_9LAMI